MSVAPIQLCPSCHKPVRGKCQQCGKAHQRTYDRQRGTATQRGYGVRWGRYRAKFLQDYPFCGDRPGWPTKDSQCLAKGLDVPATVVDHIRPVTGADDPTFYYISNHQALCSRCHDVKRQRESTDARRGTGG